MTLIKTSSTFIFKQSTKGKMKTKVLNCYAGLGGNRRLWKNVKVTAIEINEKIAEVYRDLYPNDRVIIGDAHEYLLENYKKFDFIWSSPPCQSHSSFRQNIGVRYRGVAAVYPDMSLYQEILFLKYNFGNNWVVENVKPYYSPLIEPTAILQRHLFWSNYKISQMNFKPDIIRKAQILQLQELHKIDLSDYKISNKRQILRNCVIAELGLHIFKEKITIK